MMILLLADNKMRSLNMRLAEVRLFSSPEQKNERQKEGPPFFLSPRHL